MFKNILYKPMQASQEEIETLNLRRKLERDVVLDHD
jgi:hypothetical protein